MIEQQSTHLTLPCAKKDWKIPQIILISLHDVNSKTFLSVKESSGNQFQHGGKTYVSNGNNTFTGTLNQAAS
ncbi:hypothetical protein ACFGVR_10585 [Mucilaginibacter sp. AW1-3]